MLKKKFVTKKMLKVKRKTTFSGSIKNIRTDKARSINEGKCFE